MFDHIGLRVTELAAGTRFSTAALASLGYAPCAQGDDYVGFGPPDWPALWLHRVAPGGGIGALAGGPVVPGAARAYFPAMADPDPAPDPQAPPPPPPAASVPTPAVPEIGGPKGPEPTRYGDWEHKGRCIDF